MLIKRPDDIRPTEITDERVYRERRRFLAAAATGAAIAAWPGLHAAAAGKFAAAAKSPLSTDEAPNTLEDITRYNNFYEFGTDKTSPAKLAGGLRTDGWTVSIEGEVKRPKRIGVEDLFKIAPPEERIYRLRCVETWSMVVPWIGLPLAPIIKHVEPTGNAKYVEFVTLHDPEQMPGQRSRVLDWPYVEGLRMDEAMHPLTILGVGLYGDIMPNQNGAPIRLIVPWKYGFKSIKSIVRIRFVERQPKTTWNLSAPHEYGFYANVNPQVSHPRWSQARERRIGEFLKRPTQMFNGYAEQVASLYRGMDLKKFY